MKFIDSYYDAVLGTSEVTMQHLGKKFVGRARLHPEDEENASNYAGCEIAEIRATIKALKYERKLLKEKTDIVIEFVKSCEDYKYFNKDDDTSKVLYCQLNKRIDRVNKITDEINKLYKEIEQKTRRRGIVLNAIKRYKSKKDN